MGRSEVKQRVEEILSKVEECKTEDIEEALMETLDEGYYQLKEIKEKRKKEIEQLKRKVERNRREIEAKERELEQKKRQIEELKEVETLEELTEVSELNLSEEEFASPKERQKVANKFEFLAQHIKGNDFLTQMTLKTFDRYREQLIERSLEEEDLGKRLNNISS